MHTIETHHRTVKVARLLDEASAYSRVAKTDPGGCRRGWYRRKDRILETAIEAGRGQFYIDSYQPGPPALIGVSHLHTARRFHLRLDSMSQRARRLVAEMPITSGAAQASEVAAALACPSGACGGNSTEALVAPVEGR